MIAAIATDTERAGTVVAMDIMIKAASTIAVAETIAMVATRASNGRDAAKAACWPSREEPSTDLIEPAMAGTLPDIADTIIKNRGRTPSRGDHYIVASGAADLACRIPRMPKALFA
jgi:hypothetical protein